MASRTLYPPSIASSLPAFMATKETIRIPISFSKFNNTNEFTSAHISIAKKDTGMNVVNTTDDAVNGRYRAAGIILNVPVLSSTVDGKTTYYVEIKASDLNSKVYGYSGWIPGWFYKIQVRLSAVNYPGSGGQQAWLNTNASNFSEWSTVCIIKTIGNITIDVDSFDYFYDASDKSKKNTETFGNNLVFSGLYNCEDVTETLAYYRLKLYTYPKSENDKPIEDSGYVYNSVVNVNEFNYTFKVATTSEITRYVIEVEYNTINNFNDTFNIDFTLSTIALQPVGARVITVDNDIYNIFDDISSLELEEDEGRIALKLYAADSSPYSGNLVVRRASSRDNFLIWEDIKILTFKQKPINSSPIFYDYTIESGVWYKYGVQVINQNNERSELNQTAAIMRNFEYSYLLGENNQQLKLMFNNDIGNFKRQVIESHTDTIGGKYSTFSRNAATDYKTFPVNGLISFWMDEQNTFTNKKVIYGNSDIVDLYDEYNSENDIVQYDYIYEREFRDLVSNFLYDGKPKLFKSPTEGNVIIRLTDVSMSPIQSLARMLYSFSSTGYELADNTIENYKKYNFIDLGNIETDFSVATFKIGQLIGEFNPTDNIFELIKNKYYKENVIGYTYDIKLLKGLRIQIDEKPMRILNNAGNYILGHNLKLNDNLITLRNNINVYELDNNIEFVPSNTLYLLGDADNTVKKINAVIDFIYEEIVARYEPKKIASKTTRNGLGQIYGVFEPNVSLYKIIYNKHSFDWTKRYAQLNKIVGIEIESDPGAVFYIQDKTEAIGEEHMINSTGLLVLNNISDIVQIRYLGVKTAEGGIDSTKKASVMLNYYFTILEGGYQ